MRSLTIAIAAFSVVACSKSPKSGGVSRSLRPTANLIPGENTPSGQWDRNLPDPMGEPAGPDAPLTPPSVDYPRPDTPMARGKSGTPPQNAEVVKGPTADPKPTQSAPSAPAAKTETAAKPAKKPQVSIPLDGAEASAGPGSADSGATVSNSPNRNRECGTAYRRGRESEWFPGLPNPPAKEPRVTGAIEQTQNGQQVEFTDFSQDGLLNEALAPLMQAAPEIQDGERRFASRIEDVVLKTDVFNSGRAQLEFSFRVSRENYARFVLEGRVRENNRRGVVLRQVSADPGMRFQATLTCHDQSGGCRNALIILQAQGERGASQAMIVHRKGPAHVSISKEDQFGFQSIRNSSHQRFAEFLANSAHNSCVDLIASRQVPVCAMERLQQQCGGQSYRSPSANSYTIRTWAVAYGRSGFEFSVNDGRRDILQVAGPLVISSQIPAWPRKLQTQGSVRPEKVHLIANDGGGNLNLQLVFGGQRTSVMRLGVSAMFNESRAQGGRGSDERSWVK